MPALVGDSDSDNMCGGKHALLGFVDLVDDVLWQLGWGSLFDFDVCTIGVVLVVSLTLLMNSFETKSILTYGSHTKNLSLGW